MNKKTWGDYSIEIWEFILRASADIGVCIAVSWALLGLILIVFGCLSDLISLVTLGHFDLNNIVLNRVYTLDGSIKTAVILLIGWVLHFGLTTQYSPEHRRYYDANLPFTRQVLIRKIEEGHRNEIWTLQDENEQLRQELASRVPGSG